MSLHGPEKRLDGIPARQPCLRLQLGLDVAEGLDQLGRDRRGGRELDCGLELQDEGFGSILAVRE